ncbi:MAG: hypothetical protein WD716_05760 [Fimbriimonadaceae bacterium]
MTTLLALSLFVGLQSTQQASPEIGVDFDYPNFKVECPSTFAPNDTIEFLVHVQDVDVTVYRDESTGKFRSVAGLSGGFHGIRIDPEHRGSVAGPGVPYLSQDRITVKKVGWNQAKDWYTYSVTVALTREERKDGRAYVVAIEIRDECPAPWERDRPAFTGTGICLED